MGSTEEDKKKRSTDRGDEAFKLKKKKERGAREEEG